MIELPDGYEITTYTGTQSVLWIKMHGDVLRQQKKSHVQSVGLPVWFHANEAGHAKAARYAIKHAKMKLAVDQEVPQCEY